MTSTEQLTSLTYAVRLPVVLKYLGQIALVLALLTTAPLIVALLDGEIAQSLRYLLVVALLLGGGFALNRLPTPPRMQSNEALVIAVLAFILGPLVMIWPLMGAGLTPLDAFFEAVSGVTTTGLSTLHSVEGLAPSFLFARAWMQWYGGLSIVVLSVALLSTHHTAFRQLVEADNPAESLVTTTRQHARRMFIIYLIMTAAGIAALLASGVAPFTALVHVLAAVSTGGFSSFDNSLAGFTGSAGPAVISAISIAGAISLPLYYRLYLHGTKALHESLELPALLVALLSTSALLMLFFHFSDAMPWRRALSQATAMGISAQTTTGFSTLSIGSLDPGSKLVMILSMAVGGSVGSTAGGVKLVRLLILLRMLQLVVWRSAAPAHAVLEPQLRGYRLESDDVTRALLLIGVFTALVLLSWLPFIAAGYDPLDALFEVVSACGTVGLSSGITAPTLAPGLKALLCFDMLAGRLEIIALLVLLYPRTWFGRRKETS